MVAVAGLDAVEAGTLVLIDGTRGTVTVAPDADAADASVAAARARRRREARWDGPGATADGHPVAILANVQDGAAARAARETPAEGIGLFRTELCFLNRETEPTVEEQAQIYGEVLAGVFGPQGGHAHTRRRLGQTLEVRRPRRRGRTPRSVSAASGSPTPTRTCWSASSRASPPRRRRPATQPWVMAPMIATPEEAKNFAEQARAHGLTPGVMIEVPAAALLADRILEHVDFLSIGTNDLAQYTMAADRMSAELATLTDPWQPAVLALVAMAARAGAAVGQAGRGLRRGRGRSAAGLRADRARA